jgi:hypothetical protein
VIRYIATPILSLAVNVVTGTVRVLAVDGIVKAVTVGGVTSLDAYDSSAPISHADPFGRA